MKHIVKAIEREIKSTIWAECHERFDHNIKEADRLADKIKKLIKLKEDCEAF